MGRALVALATLLAVISRAAAGQDPSVLHITVVLIDADRRPVPVPHHALLISDNPASAPPRRIVTGLDGTADVRLGPGNYTVESDTPVAFNGKVYEWTQMVDIAAGRDAALALTADNAEITSTESGTTSAVPVDTDESLLAAEWQPSVVTLWTPTARASGFVIGADGLVVTSQRSIGTATSIEVQLTPAIKAAGVVVVADAAQDVAVLRVNPMVAASVRPVPLACTPTGQPHVVSGQKVFTIDTPLHQPKGTISATAIRVAEHDIESDFYLSPGSVGGPVFTADGVVGITSVADDSETLRRRTTRIVRIDDVCGVVATAEGKMKDLVVPDGTHLPVEPPQPYPVDALKGAAERRAGSLNPYQAASASFDVSFVTPVLTYGAELLAEQRSRRERGTSTHVTVAESTSAPALADFGNWSDYVADFPPVLLVRLTPKLSEGLWTKVARGAAQTQGIAIPPIKRFTSGFSRMRAYCGDAEVTPIHPFKIERRVSRTDTIEEGLYVFDPGALAPSCGSVRLVLYSEKEPAKTDTLTVDAHVIQRIWDDFAPYRGRGAR